MITYEYMVRDIIAQRVHQAERWRLAAAAKHTEPMSARVWKLGGLVIAWSPRRRRLDPCRPDTPVVVWV